MSDTYGFGLLEDRLIDLCRQIPPDIPAIRHILSQEIDLNKTVSTSLSRSILGEIISFYGDNEGECTMAYLPGVIRLLLSAGFDLRAENGAIGGECLNALWLCSGDEHALEALEILLDNGADPEYTEDGETVLEQISFDCFFCWMEALYYRAVLLAAMERMMSQAVADRDYHQVGMYEHCIGKKLTDVFLYDEKSPPDDFFTFRCRRLCHKGSIVFLCEDLPLCITQYRDSFTDTAIDLSDRFTSRNVSRRFRKYLGHTITDITFSYPHIKRDGISYGQPTVTLHLDNGKAIRCTTNHGELPKEEPIAYCKFL